MDRAAWGGVAVDERDGRTENRSGAAQDGQTACAVLDVDRRGDAGEPAVDRGPWRGRARCAMGPGCGRLKGYGTDAARMRRWCGLATASGLSPKTPSHEDFLPRHIVPPS